MQFPTKTITSLILTFTTFLTLSTFASAGTATDPQNAGACQRKAGIDYVTAIERFCSNQAIVVPSNYATNGVTVNHAKVRIGGNCNPPTWVPSYWCKAQFHSMCAVAGERADEGFDRQYGPKKCQLFVISNKNYQMGGV